MPELPEVESIRLHLEKKLIGRKFTDLSYDWPKKFIGEKNNVLNSKIIAVRRLGKVLIFDFANNNSLLFHLKLTGQIILQKGKDRIAGGHPIPPLNRPVPNSTTRVIFKLDDGSTMYFNDLRKFGWVKIMSTSDVEKEPLVESLGPDPLTGAFALNYFAEKLAKRSIPVKVAIMDQKLVGGVGNIYANEALFLAKVDPKRKASNLSEKEMEAVYKGIIGVLKTGVKYGGASAASYIKPDGEEGVYLKYAYVYNRAGEKCKICGTKIAKMKLGGRGTYFCPSCQK